MANLGQIAVAFVISLALGCSAAEPYEPPGEMKCSYAGDIFHRRVYIDDEFEKHGEMKLIYDGLKLVEESTNGAVKYPIYGTFAHQDISSIPASRPEGVFIYRVLSKQPIDNVVWFALGAASGKSIILFADNLYGPEMWKSVTAHEIGHTIGMVHTPNPADLMAEHCGPRCKTPYFTQNDLDQVCKILVKIAPPGQVTFP